MTNFAHPSQSSRKRSQPHASKDGVPPKRKKRTWFLRIIIFIFVCVLIGGILVFVNYKDAKAAYEAAINGKAQLEKAQQLLEEQNLSDAFAAITLAREEFRRAQQHIDNASELKIIPFAGRQIVAVENILVASVQLTSALGKFVNFGEEILIILQEDKDLSLGEITQEQRTAILKKMYESPPDLQGAKAEVDLAVLAMNRIPERGVFGSIREASLAIKEKLPLIQEIVDTAVPAIETLPVIAGYPESKTYLFLLQNNSEMRATGGFIGTYGILKLENGEIKTFTTDNIYNIDNPVKDTLFISPPWQLKKYLGANQWFMRDSNWEPDFPTSAQKAEEFYHLEHGPEDTIHGVIAVTPTLIASLLELTGPITIRGIEFTSENFRDTLQYQVEVAYSKQGISSSERKDVIGELANKLMDELMGFPKERWPELWKVFQKDVNEKHILIYFKDENIQFLLEQQGWTGEIKNTDGDFLMVADENLASLKTDPVVKRNILYSVSEDKDRGLIGRVEIHYKHEGGFEWKTTRYRTYTRVYVPEGSELLEYKGVMDNDKLHGGRVGDVEVVSEFGKTRFGGFISIEPSAEGTLTFVYKLPDRIQEQIKQGSYQFLAQKQAGTPGHELLVEFDVGKKIEFYEPLDTAQKEGDNKLRFTGDLRTDRYFQIRF